MVLASPCYNSMRVRSRPAEVGMSTYPLSHSTGSDGARRCTSCAVGSLETLVAPICTSDVP
eukprot:2638980-Pyramimonas_sp.AAC.1